MLAATMPTKKAATHSMVSMKRSMPLRCTLPPVACPSDASLFCSHGGEWGSPPPSTHRSIEARRSSIGRIVLGKRGREVLQDCVRVTADLAHAVTPGLHHGL